MLFASMVKIRGSEKEREQEHKQQFFYVIIRHFFHKTCNQKVSRCSRAKQRQRNVQKKCAAPS